MITSLDSPPSRDPFRVGAKTAWLARARAAGAPVLPGFVVDGAASRAHMALGAETLLVRGSGGARLAVSSEPISFAEALVTAGEELAELVVARSSTLLEDTGDWSGAFTSYLDLAPIDLPRAVAGCWASAFSVAALQRQAAAAVEPGSFPMSVLVQPALTPMAGGCAKVTPDGTVVVRGVKGSPAPLLQGWVAGSEAWFDGSWRGDELIELMGSGNLDSVHDLLVAHATQIGANTCEWALTDRVWALQFGKTEPIPEVPQIPLVESSELGWLTDVVEVLALAPGPLGEQVVLPWAIAGLPDLEPAEEDFGATTVSEIRELCREVIVEVWGVSVEPAMRALSDLLDRLYEGETRQALEVLTGLNRPDASIAARLLGKLRSLRRELVARRVVPHQRAAWQLDLDSADRALRGEPVPAPSRAGVGRWEPLLAAVLFASGRINSGIPASPGIGAGLRAHVEEPHRNPEARGVVTASRPIPALAPLLWDAPGLITATGSPAAHLFEAARSLRVPAVCGVDLGVTRREMVAVDGHSGIVATLPIVREI